jgi:hypothetical protein
MVQYLENVLRYDRVSRWKCGLERLRMFFDAAPRVHSEKKATWADCNEKTNAREADMKERLGGVVVIKS